MSRRPPLGYAHGARRVVAALRFFAVAPRSVSELAEELRVAPVSARRLISMLARDGLLEEHPDSHSHHRRYRVAAGGYDFGLLLVSSGVRELQRRDDERNALTLSQALARYRRNRSISQETFAPMLGVTRSVLEHIETGRRRVEGHELLAFADRLGVEVFDLLR